MSVYRFACFAEQKYLRRPAGLCAAILLLLCATRGAWAATYDTTPEGNARFLADYAAQKDAVKLPDGLMYRVLTAGKGTSPVNRRDIVTVEYQGYMLNGVIFDQTKPDEPRQFAAGGVIAGWKEALFKMKSGDEWELVIPANLGYGADGIGGVIPPNQTLIFHVKLVKVEYAY